MEFHHRHAVQFENMSPLAKRRVAHTYFIKAQRAWAAGEARRALRYANLAIHYNPQSRAAIDLRADIWSRNRLGDHTAGAPFVELAEPDQLLDGQSVHPWLLDRLDPAAPAIERPLHPMDPGQPGPRVDIITPERP
jgi:hypothetical protein